MMKSPFRALAIAALAALSTACAAQGSVDEPPPAWVVVEPNASISNPNLIQDRGWARDNSIVLRTSGQNWYRAVLQPGCTERWAGASIGFFSRSGSIIDRTSDALINGQRCPLSSFDKIEPPPPGSRR